MIIKKILFAILVSSICLPSIAISETSANVGYVSDYYFRGVELGESGAYVGIDYEASGFYAGAWAIDDGTAGSGLETDFYFGYGWENDSVSFGVGYTLYEYTYTSDLESEVNLSFGTGPFGLEVALGNDDDDLVGDEDYTFVGLSLTGDVFGISYGTFDDDDETVAIASDDYTFLQVSASGEIAGMDASVTIGESSSSDGGPNNEGYLFIEVSKSFSL